MIKITRMIIENIGSNKDFISYKCIENQFEIRTLGTDLKNRHKIYKSLQSKSYFKFNINL